MFFVELQQALAARFFHLIFNLSLHPCGGCALARREAEDVRLGKLEFAGELIRLLKIVLALAREAGDDIGADSHTRNEALGRCDDGSIALTGIATSHAAQNGV